MSLPRFTVWASGTEDGGGSGFERLVEVSREGNLRAKIVGVVSNHESGGVKTRADRLGVPFHFFPGPFTLEGYRDVISELEADFHTLSGWLKCFAGTEPALTTNIHPGPLPNFGGRGMWGHHVHETVFEAYKRQELTHSAVSMHFVTWSVDDGNPDPKFYDAGPCFFRYPVEIRPEDNAETIAQRVNAMEHVWQPFVLDLIATGQISWDGENPSSLVVPDMAYFGHYFH